MSQDVYIAALASYLPNEPVSNEEIEGKLGYIDSSPSRALRIVLKNNGIQQRYYALDEDGQATHTNAELCLETIQKILEENPQLKDDLELISFGTSIPDQFLPSHTSMIHGLMNGKPLEIISPAAACCSGMHAMKHAWLAIKSGETQNAICGASELTSQMMLAKNFEKEAEKLHELSAKPIIAFEKDFLRWMLSDGAGAAWLSNKIQGEKALKIKWIYQRSYANELPTCMYSGGDKNLLTHEFTGWKHIDRPETWLEKSVFSLKQDVKVLGENIVPYGVKFLQDIIREKGFKLDGIDWFLPHLSSMFFKQKIVDCLYEQGLKIPDEKWFINLDKVGNVGSASIYLMLEELFNQDFLKKGEHLLLMVPESARFSYTYALLEVV